MIRADTNGIHEYDDTGKDGDHQAGAGAELAPFTGYRAFDTAEIYNCGNNNEYYTESD